MGAPGGTPSRQAEGIGGVAKRDYSYTFFLFLGICYFWRNTLEKKRGRKSAGSEIGLNVIHMPEKPKAPEGLSDRQQKIWE